MIQLCAIDANLPFSEAALPAIPESNRNGSVIVIPLGGMPEFSNEWKEAKGSMDLHLALS
jgi:hypothetical protein